MPTLIFMVPFSSYDSGVLGRPSQAPQKVTIEAFEEGEVLLYSLLFGSNSFQKVDCGLGFASWGASELGLWQGRGTSHRRSQGQRGLSNIYGRERVESGRDRHSQSWAPQDSHFLNPPHGIFVSFLSGKNSQRLLCKWLLDPCLHLNNGFLLSPKCLMWWR